jgi:hypothetical protein
MSTQQIVWGDYCMCGHQSNLHHWRQITIVGDHLANFCTAPHCGCQGFERESDEQQKARQEKLRLQHLIAICQAFASASIDAKVAGLGTHEPLAIEIELPTGAVAILGDDGETWAGQVFADRQALETLAHGRAVLVTTEVAVEARNPEIIAEGILEQVLGPVDVCLSGSPARGGICGDPACVCAPEFLRIKNWKAKQKAFMEAAYALNTAWEPCTVPGGYGAGHYPFAESFDEICARIHDWVEHHQNPNNQSENSLTFDAEQKPLNYNHASLHDDGAITLHTSKPTVKAMATLQTFTLRYDVEVQAYSREELQERINSETPSDLLENAVSINVEIVTPPTSLEARSLDYGF